jgi:DNA-binding transcriptional regulator YdaS (Cro superfamily)
MTRHLLLTERQLSIDGEKTPIYTPCMNEITREAIRKAGGPSAVAPECGVTKQAVSNWSVVPAHHVLTLERLSGISRYRLRPDVFGDEPEGRPNRQASACAA